MEGFFIDKTDNEITNNGQVKGFIVITQANYNALVSASAVDPKIVYLISG